MALRFARVKGYRHDKRPEDADTIDTVRAIFEGLGRGLTTAGWMMTLAPPDRQLPVSSASTSDVDDPVQTSTRRSLVRCPEGRENSGGESSRLAEVRLGRDEPLDEVERGLHATSCQPWSIVGEWPRLGIFLISVTLGLRFCRLARLAIAHGTVWSFSRRGSAAG